MKSLIKLLPSLAIGCLASSSTHADTFGSGTDTFTIDFATIGNITDGGDWGVPFGDRLYTSGFGYVPYFYRMGATEVPQAWITKATNLGLANVTGGPWTGNQPAANITWYEAAAFVNWLNTSTGHQAAYDLRWTGSAWTMNLWNNSQAWDTEPGPLVRLDLYRHKDAYYYLPSQDEWCKTAFKQSTAPNSGFYDYATGSNAIPSAVLGGTAAGTAVYSFGGQPAAVDNDGGLSPLGTRGQNGNVWEWLETADDNSNNVPDEYRAFRGGGFGSSAPSFNASTWQSFFPAYASADLGFRVASIPEPTTGALTLAVGLLGLLRRSRVDRRQ